MVGFQLYRGARLRQSFLQLQRLAQPGNTATFNFFLYGISLVSSSPDDHIVGALEFNLGWFNEPIGNGLSLGLNLDRLCTALDVADDEDVVGIYPNEDLSQFIVRMWKFPQENERIRIVGIIPPDPLHVCFDTMMVLPDIFGVRMRISSEILYAFFARIAADEDGNVGIVIQKDEVELLTGADTLRFPIGPRRCVIYDGVTDDDDVQYLTEFSLHHLRLLEGSIRMARDVSIYPPRMDGATKALKCQIACLGAITCYIQ